MTVLINVDVTCAVCGSTHTFIEAGSTNAFGPADLDGRPPEMARSTMFTWVQRCPSCGYCAHTISEKTKIKQEMLESESYQTCEGNDIKSGLGENFYRAAMILQEEGNIEKAAYMLICCAWASDDEGDNETAKTCRLKAEELLRRIPGHKDEESRMNLRMDLLRRAGQFETVLSEFKDSNFKDRVCRKYAEAELRLAEKRDDSRHTTNLIFNNGLQLEEFDVQFPESSS